MVIDPLRKEQYEITAADILRRNHYLRVHFEMANLYPEREVELRTRCVANCIEILAMEAPLETITLAVVRALGIPEAKED